MLTLYRRHTSRCNSRTDSKGRSILKLPPTELKKCECPLWVIGTDAATGDYHRETLNTSDFNTAVEQMRKIDLGQPAVESRKHITVEDAVDQFRMMLETQRGLKASTLRVFDHGIGSPLKAFATSKGVTLLKECDLAFLSEWIGSWSLCNWTRLQKIKQVQRFFRTAHQHGWISTDPAIGIMVPKNAKHGHTMPYELEHELPRILDAASHWEDGWKNTTKKNPWFLNPRSFTGLVYLLYATGLRISDAVTFDPRNLKRRTVRGREVYCYYAPSQQKTENPVFLPLMPKIAEKIINAPRISERYAFWDGSKLESWTHDIVDPAFDALARVAGVPKVRAHRFRDTFAVGLLSRGADIRAVSRLLGHTNVATTLKHYEHFLAADQDRLISIILDSQKPANVIAFPQTAKA